MHGDSWQQSNFSTRTSRQFYDAWNHSTGLQAKFETSTRHLLYVERNLANCTFKTLSDRPKLAMTKARKCARLDARRGGASPTALNCSRRHTYSGLTVAVTVRLHFK